MKAYWVSCHRFTVQANTNQANIIIWTAPITRRFIGRNICHLISWAEKLGGLKAEYLRSR